MRTKVKKPSKKPGRLNLLGNILIAISLIAIYLIFSQIIKEEAKYTLNKVSGSLFHKNQQELTPPNTDFSIIIPKIGAVAPVVADVDPFKQEVFLAALKRGVAHARGTAYPGQLGNTYLFAHSTDAFYNVGAYNAVFYLIGKLDVGDEVSIYYKGKKFIYKVYDKKVVAAGELKYLASLGSSSTLTLQTCYPPGTTLRRLVVLANLAEISSNP